MNKQPNTKAKSRLMVPQVTLAEEWRQAVLGSQRARLNLMQRITK